MLSEADWSDLEGQLCAMYNLRIVKMLGEGGMARAYKALDASGADKVVKVNTTQAGSELEHEYEHMEWHRHPNILHVYKFLTFG